MENLKFGDIKKFIKGDKEFVGVVVRVDKSGITLINTDGKMGDFSFRDDLRYSATRLDPKLRTQLEKIAEEKRKYDKMEEDYKKLAIAKDKQLELLRGEISKVLDIQGKIGLKDLCRVFQDKLKKVNPYLSNKLEQDYSWEAYNTPVGIWMQMHRDEYFAKWASPSDYDFIYREYDGQLMIANETKQYKDLCKKYSRKNVEFTMSDLKGKFKSEDRIQVGDKGTLNYSHTISILIPQDCMNEIYLDKLIATIKY